MNPKHLAAAVLLGPSSICAAQPFFTQANVVPAFGTYEYAWYSELADPASPIDTNATTATWDFSATEIAGAFYYQVTIGPASETPYAASSDGADICWTYNYSWGNDHWYYRNDPDSLIWTTNLTDIFDDDVYTSTVCRAIQMVYPASLGDVVIEDVTECEGPINGYPKIWRRKLIGTGTLITSLGTFNNVLLVKDRLSAWNEMGVPPFPVYTESYLWFLPNNALEPLAIWGENQGLNYLSMRILTPTTGLTEQANNATITLQPNPVTDLVTISSTNGTQMGEVRIHAADGRVVRELGPVALDRLTVDVQDLKPGVYTVSCNTGALPVVLRFVKE